MAFTLTICLLGLVFNAYSAYGILYAQKGKHFQTVINKNDFFKNQNNIKFTVSIVGMPDLPTWLKLRQKDPRDVSVLYGTPNDEDSTVKLRITGWNKETYATATQNLIVVVTDKDPAINQPIELRIKNKDITDMMENSNHFFKTINSIWPGAQYISNIERPMHRVGLDFGDFNLVNNKESVFVGVIGNSEFPSDLMSLKSKCDSISSANNIQTVFLNSGYDIDWCSFKNLSEDSVSLAPKFKFLGDNVWYDAHLTTSKWSLERADLTLGVVYVFIAVFVGLVLIIFLTCLMCFNREGLQHRNNLTPKEQLLHHKALRRAGAQLRNMSGKDEPNGFPYGKLDEDSKNGTLSSNKPPSELESSPSPPPYRYNYGNDRVKRQDSKF